ncbi:hypothetical protein ACQP2K_25350 [Microbispora siamensis]
MPGQDAGDAVLDGKRRRGELPGHVGPQARARLGELDKIVSTGNLGQVFLRSFAGLRRKSGVVPVETTPQ